MNFLHVFGFHGLQIGSKFSLLLLESLRGFFLTDDGFAGTDADLLNHALVVTLLLRTLSFLLLNFHGEELDFLLELCFFFLEIVFKQLFLLLELLAKLV